MGALQEKFDMCFDYLKSSLDQLRLEIYRLVCFGNIFYGVESFGYVLAYSWYLLWANVETKYVPFFSILSLID